jgi:hypothetical protein
MVGAYVSCSTPARFKLCGSPPALHIAPEKSGAGFGEHHISVPQRSPLLRCCNGPGITDPGPFLFAGTHVVISVSAVGRTPNPRINTMSTRLDPEEALAGPLYVVAIVLILIPALDFAFSVPPGEFSSVQWRFAAVGIMSGNVTLPFLGLALALTIAGVTKQFPVVRVLLVMCLTLALALIVISLGFMLDVLQLLASVPPEGRPAFNSAWIRAISKLALSAVALGFLGWRARRMIPAQSRHRTPKTVHVVSK